MLTADVTQSAPAPVPASPELPGTDLALHVLEGSLIGGPISAQTNELIHKQLNQLPTTNNPTDTLNVLTALVMGSPDFQLH